MNIDELTLGDIKKLKSLFSEETVAKISSSGHDNKLIGRYVLVRCHDAGIHAGYLESSQGRSCILKEARRIWYWKPAENQSFLSGVATHGLDISSKVGNKIVVQELTENCEIMLCTDKAEKSITEMKPHEQ